jgi:hypothetical protein
MLQDGQKVRTREHNDHKLRQVLTIRKGKYSVLSIIHVRIIRFADYSLTILMTKFGNYVAFFIFVGESRRQTKKRGPFT